MRINRKWFLVGMMFCVCCVQTWQAYAQLDNLRFSNISVEEGLSHAQVDHILQDSYGYMWIATKDGLNRYDGYYMEVFKSDEFDSTSLLSNEIKYVYEDSKRRVWIATDHGLCMYDRAANNFKQYPYAPDDPEGLHAQIIWTVFEDHKGMIWLGAVDADYPFCFLNPETDIFTNSDSFEWFDKSMMSKLACNTYAEVDGRLFIGTSGGLMVLDRSRKTKTQVKVDELTNSFIENLRVANDGESIWVCTRGGVILLSVNTLKRKAGYFPRWRRDDLLAQGIDGPFVLTHSHCLDMVERDDKIWIATRSGFNEVNKHSGETVTHYPKKGDDYSIVSKQLSCIELLKGGDVMWIGSSGGGISQLDLNSQAIKLFDQLPAHEAIKASDADHPAISRCSYDSLGNWLLCHWDGVWVFDDVTNTSRQILREKRGGYLPKKTAEPACTPLSKDLLLLAYGWKLYKINPSNNYSLIEKTEVRLGNRGGGVKSILPGEEDTYWVLTAYGLFHTDKDFKELKGYEMAENSVFRNHGTFSCMIKDRKGNLWIASRGSGLYHYDMETESITHFENQPDNPNSLSGNMTISLHEDKKGNIWIATKKGGLNAYNPTTKEFTCFRERDGLPSYWILSIEEGNDGYIWFSTVKGLAKLNPETGECLKFIKKDGLQDIKFMKHSSASRSSDGAMMFGGPKGLNYIRSNGSKKNEHPPRVAITSLQINNSVIRPDDGSGILSQYIGDTETITLNHDQNAIYFDFSAMDFANAMLCEYAFMLEGLDEGWIYKDARQRFASYSNIAPGEYVFKVKASNNDGVWSQKATEIKIVVHPPFWQTWWFRGGAILLLILVVYWIYKTILLRQNEKALAVQVEERTRELTNKTQEIEQINEELRQQQEELVSTNEALEHQKEELSIKNEQIHLQKSEIEVAYQNIKELSDFGKEITSTLDIEAISGVVYKFLREVLDASVFGLALHDKEKRALSYIHIAEKGVTLDSFDISLDEENSFSVICYRQQIMVAIDDLSVDYNKYIPDMPSIRTDDAYQSMLYVPLSTENYPIGIITVQSEAKNAYSLQAKNIIQTLAAYLSIALDNGKAYGELKEKNQMITDSIRYAKRIQQSIVPREDVLAKAFTDAFAIFYPKDIVSGDFYWFAEYQGKKIIAAIDCTGHGVPGGFMSMTGNTLLNEIVNQKHITSPAEIMESLNQGVLQAFKQDGKSNDDGMDVCLCVIEYQADGAQVVFTGAKRPLLILSGGELQNISGDRKAIGGIQKAGKVFTNQTFDLPKGSQIFLTTDGYVDQSGGPQKKKLGTAKFLEVLTEHAAKSLEEKKSMLEHLFFEHKGDLEQRDDVTLIGIEI